MPNRDKTGPMGEGPKTGRGLGPCGDGTLRGLNQRNGQGRGRRNQNTPRANQRNNAEVNNSER